MTLRAECALFMRSFARFVPAFLVAGLPAFARAAPPAIPSGSAPSPAPAHAGERTPVYTAPSTPVHTAAPAQRSVFTAPPPSPPPQPPPAPTTAVAEKEKRKHARYMDAHADRVVVVPTAETHPEGTAYFSSYELVLLQGGYAVSDRTQVTLTVIPPLTEDFLFLADASVKTVLVREDLFRLAVIGSVSGIAGMEEGNYFFGRATATAQFCFERFCRSSISVANSTLLAGPATLNYSGIGAIWRLSSAFALLFETNNVLPLSRDAGPYNGLTLGPGVRLSWSTFAADFAVQWAADAQVDDDEAPPALPFLALTYRFLP